MLPDADSTLISPHRVVVHTFDSIRFPALIKFHQEINASLPREAVSVAGPYWGLNLVLWAKGIVKHPAIGIVG
jgi:hypothetical protein